VRYQTFSEHNFTMFDELYTANPKCTNETEGATENVGCHNFAKPVSQLTVGTSAESPAVR
jgi:hypothetical protein